jgi:hypothetical protein
MIKNNNIYLDINSDFDLERLNFITSTIYFFNNSFTNLQDTIYRYSNGFILGKYPEWKERISVTANDNIWHNPEHKDNLINFTFSHKVIPVYFSFGYLVKDKKIYIIETNKIIDEIIISV